MPRSVWEPQKKRRIPAHYRNGPNLRQVLDIENITGLLEGAAVWIAANQELVKLLDCSCLGQLEAPTVAALAVARTLAGPGATLETPDSSVQCVRFSLVEALFLAYGLRKLVVFEVQDSTVAKPKLLSCEELWHRCSSLQANFKDNFASYYHLRCKGWLPQSGLQYGTDWVVYQKHPAAVHSTLCCLVVPDGCCPSWNDVEACNRLGGQVGKRLLLLYIHVEPGGPQHFPDCLAYITVEERMVRRWVAEQGREGALA